MFCVEVCDEVRIVTAAHWMAGRPLGVVTAAERESATGAPICLAQPRSPKSSELQERAWHREEKYWFAAGEFSVPKRNFRAAKSRRRRGSTDTSGMAFVMSDAAVTLDEADPWQRLWDKLFMG